MAAKRMSSTFSCLEESIPAFVRGVDVRHRVVNSQCDNCQALPRPKNIPFSDWADVPSMPELRVCHRRSCRPDAWWFLSSHPWTVRTELRYLAAAWRPWRNKCRQTPCSRSVPSNEQSLSRAWMPIADLAAVVASRKQHWSNARGHLQS